MALFFDVFGVNGVPNTAMFYFKNVKGEIIDLLTWFPMFIYSVVVEQQSSKCEISRNHGLYLKPTGTSKVSF